MHRFYEEYFGCVLSKFHGGGGALNAPPMLRSALARRRVHTTPSEAPSRHPRDHRQQHPEVNNHHRGGRRGRLLCSHCGHAPREGATHVVDFLQLCPPRKQRPHNLGVASNCGLKEGRHVVLRDRGAPV